ncbi:hypothetical protein AB0H86_06790 [Streptomyces sp. NPDC050997]|uniref:hypothetical protein n=1 Tax=Streptomyces sp. NPDC050997 TaxID=3155519 RepID=UPI00342E4733
MPEAGVLVVIIIVAAALAVAGLPALSVFVLMAEAVSLGIRLLVRLRRRVSGHTRAAEA